MTFYLKFKNILGLKMRLSIFNDNDNVLLLGEGNFSFSVVLFQHNLTISLTATCYESDPISDSAKNNIDYLKNNGSYYELNYYIHKIK